MVPCHILDMRSHQNVIKMKYNMEMEYTEYKGEDCIYYKRKI